MKRRLTVLMLTLMLSACGLTSGNSQTTSPTGQGKKMAYAKGTQRPYVIDGKTYYPLPHAAGFIETGPATWYGPDFHGKSTSNGESYNMHARTAAHKTLPMNTMVLVRNLDNGRETVVRINDRGPFAKGRILDLSRTAAEDLSLLRPGSARVEVVALGESSKTPSQEPPQLKDFVQVPDFKKGEFYVQVGSFIRKDNAMRLAQQFARQQRPVMLQEFITDKATYTRVQVFAGDTLPAARVFERQLEANGYPDAFVIAR